MSHYTHVYFRDVQGGRWDAECSVCDFKVTDLSSFESADDVANWHQGLPSYIGAVAEQEPETPIVDRTQDSDFECALVFAPLFYDTPEGL